MNIERLTPEVYQRPTDTTAPNNTPAESPVDRSPKEVSRVPILPPVSAIEAVANSSALKNEKHNSDHLDTKENPRVGKDVNLPPLVPDNSSTIDSPISILNGRRNIFNTSNSRHNTDAEQLEENLPVTRPHTVAVSVSNGITGSAVSDPSNYSYQPSRLTSAPAVPTQAMTPDRFHFSSSAELTNPNVDGTKPNLSFRVSNFLERELMSLRPSSGAYSSPGMPSDEPLAPLRNSPLQTDEERAAGAVIQSFMTKTQQEQVYQELSDSEEYEDDDDEEQEQNGGDKDDDVSSVDEVMDALFMGPVKPSFNLKRDNPPPKKKRKVPKKIAITLPPISQLNAEIQRHATMVQSMQPVLPVVPQVPQAAQLPLPIITQPGAPAPPVEPLAQVGVETPAAVTESSTSYTKKKRLPSTRSKSGCWTCRIRKKKCSEEKPSCGQCSRLGLECSYAKEKPAFMMNQEEQKKKLQEIKEATSKVKKFTSKKKSTEAVDV